MTVNGMNILVPDNTVVTMPGVTALWSHLEARTDLRHGDNGVVGLEATVAGNLVETNTPAGVAYVAGRDPTGLIHCALLDCIMLVSLA